MCRPTGQLLTLHAWHVLNRYPANQWLPAGCMPAQVMSSSPFLPWNKVSTRENRVSRLAAVPYWSDRPLPQNYPSPIWIVVGFYAGRDKHTKCQGVERTLHLIERIYTWILKSKVSIYFIPPDIIFTTCRWLTWVLCIFHSLPPTSRTHPT